MPDAESGFMSAQKPFNGLMSISIHPCCAATRKPNSRSSAEATIATRQTAAFFK